MQALKCTVLRDGELKVMDSKYLVPGDIVEVSKESKIATVIFPKLR